MRTNVAETEGPGIVERVKFLKFKLHSAIKSQFILSRFDQLVVKNVRLPELANFPPLGIYGRRCVKTASD